MKIKQTLSDNNFKLKMTPYNNSVLMKVRYNFLFLKQFRKSIHYYPLIILPLLIKRNHLTNAAKEQLDINHQKIKFYH